MERPALPSRALSLPLILAVIGMLAASWTLLTTALFLGSNVGISEDRLAPYLAPLLALPFEWLFALLAVGIFYRKEHNIRTIAGLMGLIHFLVLGAIFAIGIWVASIMEASTSDFLIWLGLGALHLFAPFISVFGVFFISPK